MFSVSVRASRGLLIRVHRGGGGYGSPYCAVFFVAPEWGRLWWRRWLRRKPVATIQGLVASGLNLREFAEATRAVEAELKARGFTAYRYERVKRGRSIWYEKEL